MVDEVKTCVDAKVNFFEEYFYVPDNFKSEMDMFIKDTKSLGEHCTSASEFEQKFSTSGLSDQFNTLISKCTPKGRKMTKEEKKQSARIAGDILRENKGELIEDALTDVANRIINDEKDKILEENRKKMIDEGTYADYTIRRNNIERIGDIFGFLGNIFGNKKNKK